MIFIQAGDSAGNDGHIDNMGMLKLIFYLVFEKKILLHSAELYIIVFDARRFLSL